MVKKKLGNVIKSQSLKLCRDKYSSDVKDKSKNLVNKLGNNLMMKVINQYAEDVEIEQH